MASWLFPSALVLSSPELLSSPQLDPRVISLFGSSVADGAYCSNNCSGHSLDPSQPAGGCYQSRLREYQATYANRAVFNSAHGGDSTTALLNRFDQMVSTHASIVYYGLSLANEGLVGAADPQKVFDHYVAGMTQLLNQTRALGASPIVAGCYPNGAYSETEYGFVKQMNILTQTNLGSPPGVNFLGAIDDGHGHWVQDFYANGGHPNDLGSTEMYYAIVPSLFDAIAAGKPSLIPRANGTQFTTFGQDLKQVQFHVPKEQTIHAFTLSFNLRCSDCTGQVASVVGAVSPPPPPKGCPADWCESRGYKPDECQCGVCGSYGGCTFSCTPDATAGRYACNSTAAPSSGKAVVIGEDGRVTFESVPLSGARSWAASPVVNDGNWHTVDITHYWCNATSNLYIDGVAVSQTAERLEPTTFSLDTPENGVVDMQDLRVYRSGMNPDELSFNRDTSKTMVLQASLEVYAPLSSQSRLENRAQSMTTLSSSSCT